MSHSFMRLMLCWLHIAYRKPVIGARYYYASSGPFSPERITPLEVMHGWVNYGIEDANGAISTTWTGVDTFALMCRRSVAK